MKRFFKELMNILESMGNARAAAVLARQGYYDEARKIMTSK